jgi:hypothetical protein
LLDLTGRKAQREAHERLVAEALATAERLKQQPSQPPSQPQPPAQVAAEEDRRRMILTASASINKRLGRKPGSKPSVDELNAEMKELFGDDAPTNADQTDPTP